jgi:hypothetical protein
MHRRHAGSVAQIVAVTCVRGLQEVCGLSRSENLGLPLDRAS